MKMTIGLPAFKMPLYGICFALPLFQSDVTAATSFCGLLRPFLFDMKYRSVS